MSSLPTRIPVSPVFAIAAAPLLVLAAGCGPRTPPSPWQPVAVATDADFTGLCFVDTLDGWACGGAWDIPGGLVGRTRDGGRTWRFESGILSGGERGQGLGRLHFADSLRGCATAGQGRILVTDDGGATWRGAQGLGYGELFGLGFADATHGWAVGSEVVATQDAGETWQTLGRSPAETGALTGVCFLDAMRGWMVTHAGGLLHSVDGGLSWVPVRLPMAPSEHPILWDVSFCDDLHGWVCGEHGTLFHTSDGGANWEPQQDGVPVVRVIPKGEPPRPREVVPELETEPDRLSLASIRFADAERGWAVGYYADVAESVVLHTDDGGARWTTERVQPGELLRTLCVLDRRHAWAAGDRARRLPHVVLRYVASAR